MKTIVEDLIIERFYSAQKAGWIDYYVVCSGRILSLNEHKKVVEVKRLPENAESIEFAEITGGSTTVPTRAMCEKIVFIGSKFGDDITLLLANDAVVIRFLNHDPTSGQSMPEIRFFNKQQLRQQNEIYDRESMTPLPLEL